ncbi:MAG: FAD-dependent oxidoreductase [Planctomycetes bacterium]|nr:FAD-dependent oxidoreductase [Planctomycetota bacterium]
MSSKQFELIIIGGGAAGFAAATRADELKIKTAIINAGLPMGGTCVNAGCVPTKYFLAVGKELYSPKHPKFKSVPPIQVTFDFEEAMKEKVSLLNSLRQKNYQDVLNSFRHVTWIEGRGIFESEHIIRVGNRLLEGDKILIATGCSSKIPPIEGLNDAGYITNKDALSLPKQPSTLVILGGGPLGLEFAKIFSRMGTKVTLLTHGQRILSIQEPEISELLKGIETEKDCQVKINEFLQTNIPHIYAAGDCVCHICLETVAAKEGKIAVENALENARKRIDFSTIPYAVFTDPEVASVGLTEAKYSEKYKTCDCRTISMDKVPKALAVNDTRGLLKMVVHHETKKIVGVHILSPVASEMIHEAVLVIKCGLTVDDIIDTVHVFPTFSEAIKIAAQAYRRDISTMSCCVE